VTVVTSEAAAPALRAHLVEAVVVTIPESQSAAAAVGTILDLANHATAFAVGPGLGLDERTGAIVRGVAERIELPFVADASALFHFAKHLELLRAKRCVLTPHAGEFARLSGKGSVGDGERVERLREFVHRTAIVTLLKGQSTLIYDGATMHVNTSGNNALATAGTGDVLTGIIATLLAQGLAPVDAARLGAYWHGLTGKRCAAERSRGVIAGDLPDALASALSEPPHPAGIVRVF
jgi:NAD(P)H-hydrate epimerase